MYKIETKKDKRKIFRTIFEFLLLCGLLVILLRIFMDVRIYQPYDANDRQIVSGEDKGFLAISYLGVDRTGTDTLISSKRLEEHMKALEELGYVTITQQDIINYYEKGTPLPDKAMFLMFEDGRRDTAIFAEKLLEKYNFLGTILTYAEKFETKDNKFLMPKDLEKLSESTWWEIGSNGYRLSYINAYDRYDRFLGELISREYIGLTSYLGRDYNHYLMDYIRDKDGLPIESHQAMEERLTHDYELMERIYTDELGEVPKAYVLMHANTGMFGENEAVSLVNQENMERLFPMNFNREGYSLNDRNSSVYDLTRMQPQAYWYTNHLLMRIKYDLKEEDQDTITFVTGEEERGKDWTVSSGAAEFKGNQIVLTSEPSGKGVMRLNGEQSWEDLHVTVRLTGNKVGTQSLGLRASEDCANGIFISLENNHFVIRQRTAGTEATLFAMDLWEFDPHKLVSVEGDSQKALITELKLRGRYSESFGEWLAYHQEMEYAKKQDVWTVEDGAKEYVPELQIHDLGDRKLDITLQDDVLSVQIDGRDAAQVFVQAAESGGICLESAWGGDLYSQRNIADDVYDGVFEDLSVYSLDSSPITLYKNTYGGMQKMKHAISVFSNSIVDWFVTNL